VDLLITPEFLWRDRHHGMSLRWWIIVEVYYFAYIILMLLPLHHFRVVA
jgi:hypothetical protein